MSFFRTVDRREDPVLSHNFLVTLLESNSDAAMEAALSNLGNSAAAGFSECSGLEMSLEIEEHKQGGQNSHVLKFPSRTTWTNITLKRGLSSNSDLWDWYYGFVEGRGARLDGIVVLQDSQHLPHTIWSFRRGLPAKYTGPSMNAGQSNVAIETLEIAHEGLEILPNDNMGMIEVGPFVSEVF